MTPAARVSAAIEVLDAVLSGESAEKTLTTWARRSRFAGSGDRAAIRDHVFDALRCRRSYGWLGGGDTGRGLMIGALRALGTDPEALFTGEGYAPPPLGSEERVIRDLAEAPLPVALDIPDWLEAPLRDSLGGGTKAILRALQSRAPVFLRVNLRKATPDEARARLQEDGIGAKPHTLSETALEVSTHPRKVQTSRAFLDGLVELQDAASQAVVDALPLAPGARVLDYCAGGGGKALAMASRADVTVVAHDADPARMRDLPSRAARAGVVIETSATEDLPAAPPFDLVLCDAPCSGSGAWRRSPEAKWRLTPERLAELCAVQADILDRAAALVAPGGVLAYATCSLLRAENGDQMATFRTRHRAFGWLGDRVFTPLDGGDGFYVAQMGRLTDHP